ncbi:MAG: SRPBCC family protein [Amphritea sp.]
MAATEVFDITRYTSAPLKMQAVIEYQGKTPEEVFAVLGDPEKIPDWYLLAKEVRMHPPKEDGDVTFNVVFTFFGDVYEEVLHWDPPHRYVYLAKGDEFPIKDYIAEIEVVESQPGQGTMTWNIYCQEIEGEHFQKILPVILPPINEASIKRLTPLIGGTGYKVNSFF